MTIPSSRRPQSPARVLIVEDDDVVAGFIQTILAMEGYDVYRASNGQEALELAHELNPDLVTLDVMMPGLDGWEVALRLRADEVTAGTRIVMVSAIPIAELSRRASSESVEAVLSKPFDFAALVEVVEQTLEFAA